jgi:hypothetical protein
VTQDTVAELLAEILVEVALVLEFVRSLFGRLNHLEGVVGALLRDIETYLALLLAQLCVILQCLLNILRQTCVCSPSHGY